VQQLVDHLLDLLQAREDLFGERELKVLQALRYARDLTDREIVLALGFQDMNSCRPRITELIEKGVLEHSGDKQDPVTGKRVRTVSIRKDPRKPQMEFQLGLERATA
jgi:hypothetical protein